MVDHPTILFGAELQVMATCKGWHSDDAASDFRRIIDFGHVVFVVVNLYQSLAGDLF